jgi:hypothetical protein
MLPRRSLYAATAVAILLAVARPAAADAGDNPKAHALFLEGRAALDKGDYPTACAKFTASLALAERASALLNLAQCEQIQGRLVAALAHWQKGIALLPPGDDRVAVSRERAAALAARVPRFTLELDAAAPPGTRVEVDGADADLADLRSGKPLDPGRHTIVLIAPGHAEQRATVILVEREAKTVTLAISPPIASSGGSAVRTAGFAIGGVGVASLIVAGVTGGMLVARNATIQADCPNKVCSRAGFDLINGGGPLEIANAVAWGVGLAGIATGVIMVAVGHGPKATQIAPTALPGGGGLWATGRF